MLAIDPYLEANDSLPLAFLQRQHRITWPDQPLVHSAKPFNTLEIKLHWKSSGSSHCTGPEQSYTAQASNRPTGCPDTPLWFVCFLISFDTHVMKSQLIHEQETGLSPSDCRESCSASSSLQSRHLARPCPLLPTLSWDKSRGSVCFQ